MQIKDIKDLNSNTNNDLENDDVISDIRYICKSCSLITESLQKGCDVMQLPNGDIIITEMKPVTFQYSWDAKKGKLVRSQFGSKHRKIKSRSSDEEYIDDELTSDSMIKESVE
jgi:hypothetical protein